VARQSLAQWFAELGKFGFVGGVAYVVDTGLFNLLMYGPGKLLLEHPTAAKVISAAVATVVAWLGNRYWTFARRRRQAAGRELVMFVAVNVGGMLVTVATLWFSYYVLGLTSPLQVNISANVVGVGLATIFRYVMYRFWVFTADGAAAPPSPAPLAEGPRQGPAPSGPR